MDRFDDFADIVSDLAETRSDDDVYQVAVAAARRQLGADTAIVVIGDAASCRMVARSSRVQRLRDCVIPPSRDAIGWAIAHGEAVIVPDTDKDDRVHPELTSVTALRSLVAVPIRPAHPLGALGAGWVDRERAHAEHARTLAAIAGATELALLRTRSAAERGRDARMRAIFDNALQSFLLLDRELRIVEWNQTANQTSMFVFGRGFEGGEDARALMARTQNGDRFETNCATALAGQRVTSVSSVGGRDGARRWFETCYTPVHGDDGAIVGVAMSALDVTEREHGRALREQMMRTQRTEAIGRLTQGIAHDFNNALTPILCSAQVLRGRAGDDSRAIEELATIDGAARHAATLTRQLLAFSRKQVVDIRPLDLNSEVRQAIALLSRTTPETIEVRAELGHDLPPVYADAGQLMQILLNLVINAVEAMPDGGSVTVTTRVAPAAPPDGARIEIAVADTGHGIPPDIQSRVFEQFFTTKLDSGGSGLGLSTCHAIVSQHGGNLTLDSRPGGGATFRIVLPVGQAPTPLAPADAPRVRSRGGDETILVVDDDERLAGVVQRILADHGYRVLSASAGAAALDAAERHARPVDLVVTDVVLPGISGPELLGRLRARHPRVSVLYVSGHADAAIRRVLRADAHFLAKPFTADELTQTVRSVLDGEPPPRLEPG